MTPKQRALADSAMYLNRAVEQINEQKARITALEAENAKLREALEPFRTFAENNIDEMGWTSNTQKERIVDWFGPSDFAATLSQIDKPKGTD